MKTYTREEAIKMMLDGKQMTSDEFTDPDISYCVYDSKENKPFRYIDQYNNSIDLNGYWNIRSWRERKYIPKDQELVWCWDNEDISSAELRYYDAKNNCTYNSEGKRNYITYDNYAPFNGNPPLNICKPEDLEIN